VATGTELDDIERAYVGARWFSRFLGAPPVADDLSGRDDFCPLADLADVALGLKSGADGWFFVRTEDRPKVKDTGRPRLRSTVHVIGLKGWEGELSTADVVGALLNPHTLIERRRGQQSLRRLAPPATADVLYVAPQDRAPAHGLSDYIKHGERNGVNGGQLVRDNADGPRWWRQKRVGLRSPWALPYNSAYDYGPHDNAAGRMLNGRFVGVTPKQSIDADLLGAALLSTFVIVTRLQEGVATGSEGAYDVGPPAARLMRVPDVRRFTNAAGVQTVRDALRRLRADNEIPAAPSRNGTVDSRRRALDEAILKALGLNAGQTAVVLDAVYSGYAQWRSATEDVEHRMREHRRTLAAAGRNRTEDPTEVVARTIVDELSATGRLPALPADALSDDVELQQVAVADTFTRPNQDSLFEGGVIVAPNGSKVDLGNYARARYAAMLVEIGFSSPVLVPTSDQVCQHICDRYDDAAQKFERDAGRLARQYMPGDGAIEAVQIARRLWRHACQAAGMRLRESNPLQAADDATGD
jgi:hypothetical protein